MGGKDVRCPFRHFGMGGNKCPLCHVTEWEYNVVSECMYQHDYPQCPRYKKFGKTYKQMYPWLAKP